MPSDALLPVAGDPFAVADAARVFESVAAEVAATSAKLRAVSTGSWTGTAASRVRQRRISLPPKPDRVRVSYATAASTLHRYASALAQAQNESAGARRAADVAAADLSAARASAGAAAARDAQAAAAATAAGATPPPPSVPLYDVEIADAANRLARATAANVAAHDAQRNAARAAAASLQQASHEGIKNQPWWRHAAGTVARSVSSTWLDSLRLLSRVATTVSALAGVAALIVSVAGVFFPPLEAAAAMLETISLISGIAGTIADAALAATGRTSWAAVGFDALALAPWAGSKLTRKAGRLMRNLETKVYAKTGEPPSHATLKLKTTDSWGVHRKLGSHVRRHGPDFDVNSADDYATAASAFFQHGLVNGLPTKIASDGSIRVYEPKTNTFGAYNADGTTRTFYKPDAAEHGLVDNAAYWRKQEGGLDLNDRPGSSMPGLWLPRTR